VLQLAESYDLHIEVYKCDKPGCDYTAEYTFDGDDLDKWGEESGGSRPSACPRCQGKTEANEFP